MPFVAFIGSELSDSSNITGPGVPTVLMNGNIVSILGDNCSDGGTMVTASSTVFAGGTPICRIR